MHARTATFMLVTAGIYVIFCRLLEPIAFHALNKVLASCAVLEGLTFVQAVATIRSRFRLPATFALHRFAGLLLRALVALLGVVCGEVAVGFLLRPIATAFLWHRGVAFKVAHLAWLFSRMLEVSCCFHCLADAALAILLFALTASPHPVIALTIIVFTHIFLYPTC